MDMVLGTTVQPCTVKVISCCTCAVIFVCMSVCECMHGCKCFFVCVYINLER